MNESEQHALRRLIIRLPPFASRVFVEDRLRIEPLLGGLTNRSFLLSVDDQRYVLRLPGAGTSAYINRRNEAYNAAIAARLGINAELLYADADGVQLSRYLDGRALGASTLRQPQTLTAAAKLLRRLHQSSEPFHGDMRLFPKLDQYLALAAANTKPDAAGLLNTLKRLRDQAEPLRYRLAQNPEPLRPCHIDPAPQNFYAAGNTLYLLDWEYAARCEPTWDLAALALEAELDAAQTAQLLGDYYGDAAQVQQPRFNDYRRGLLLVAAAWAAVQLAQGNNRMDFRVYIEGQIKRYGCLCL